MGSDSINAGTELRIGQQMVFRASWVHNKLIRTIEDLGVLVNGNEEYYYANPGEGGALITPTSGLTKPFPTPKASRTWSPSRITPFSTPDPLSRESTLRKRAIAALSGPFRRQHRLPSARPGTP
ncbi:MAG: hypothetical protein NTV52_09705, partial [Acidobacteria bacterium]|nr:hypothetical protein [Acidobacteriota bacterium]